jgi:hypothetical protein
MDADERLAIMIRACVDEEVRDLAFPDDLIERVTAKSPRWVMPSVRLPALAAVLATASLLIAIPVGFNLHLIGGPTVQGPGVSPSPKNPGDGRIAVTTVPKGFSVTTDKGPQELTRSRGASRTWQLTFKHAGVKGGRGGSITVRVYSGGISISNVLLDYTGDSSLLRTRELRLSQGQAVILTQGAKKTIVWEREPELIVLADAENVSRAELIKIAEGVTIK